MGDCQDRTVVVTGGAGGIGEAIVRRFIREGATVIVADVHTEKGHELAQELGDRCRFVRLDVSEEADWRQLLEVLEGLGQPCAGLIQCAGIFGVTSIVDGEPAMYRRILDVNLFGTWLGMHVLGPALRRAKNGAIINFSSVLGIYARPNMSASSSSKWGIRGLTKTAALEFGHDGVRVLSIHPGPIRTEMASTFDTERFATMPIHRFGEVEEVLDGLVHGDGGDLLDRFRVRD
jgi:3alpha(or 20beta)-hydroxysteroid dehydrogenase